MKHWQTYAHVALVVLPAALAACATSLPTMQDAAMQGNTKAVLLLLDQGADVNARTDRKKVTGMTPLHWAAMYGQTDTVKALLARGADVNARTGYSGETAIQLAVTPDKEERGETVRVLLEAGADVHNKSTLGATLLCTAAHYRQIPTDIVGGIVDKAGNIEERDGEGQTPLWCAAGSPYGRRDNVRLLLARGANVNARDNHGKSVLAIAAQVGNTEVVRMLLAKGADVSIKDQNGYTALDLAESNKQMEVVALLERAIAKQQPTAPSPSSPAPAAVLPVSDVDQPPRGKPVARKNAYAVVIGIEQYRERLPKADFADHDAKIMADYLTRVLGYPEENIVVRLNERATRTDLAKYFEDWLRNNVEAGGSVFIYYSGHGAPDPRTGEVYLVPFDGDPSFVETTAYPLRQLYAALDKLPAKEVTVVLDSCFSGAGGRSVIAKGARPMVLSVENTVLAGGKTIVLAASSGAQISSTFQEQGHGLLTYFFLKGLQGEGDLNHDGAIDLAELYEYVKPNVQRIARKQYNNEQTPQLLASPELLRRGGGKLVGAGKP